MVGSFRGKLSPAVRGTPSEKHIPDRVNGADSPLELAAVVKRSDPPSIEMDGHVPKLALGFRGGSGFGSVFLGESSSSYGSQRSGCALAKARDKGEILRPEPFFENHGVRHCAFQTKRRTENP